MHDRHRRAALKRLARTGMAAGALVAGVACSRRDAPAAPPAELPVRIISTEGTQVLTLQRLMGDKGYFRDFGVAPSLVTVASGTTLIGSLLNGESDVCMFAGFSALLTAIARGSGLRILGAASVGGQYALLAKDPGLRRVQHLEGRTIGVGQLGAQLHHATVALLLAKGVAVDRVRFVNVGTSAAVFRAVAAGVVDAGPGQADVLGVLDRYDVHVLEDGDFGVELPEYTWQASCASMQAIREKREVLVRTLAAYCRAFRHVQRDADSQQDFVQAQLQVAGGRDRDQLITGARSQWQYLQHRRPYAEDLALSPARLAYMQALNQRIAGQRQLFTYEQLIDDSLAREAVMRVQKSLTGEPTR